MKRMGRPGRTPIGVDLGNRYIRAVQLARMGSGWRVDAATALPRGTPNGEVGRSEIRQLRGVLDRQGFAGTSVVLAVPTEKLLTGILNVPPRDSGAPVDQIARAELARIHKCKPDSLEMACWDLPAPSHGKEVNRVMAAGCAHASADALADCFEDEGLNVQALDIHACAVVRACAPLLAEGITCLLDMGWAAARLALLYQDVIVYERALEETGIRPLYQAMGERLGLSFETIDSVLGEVGVRADAEGETTGRESFRAVRGMISAHLASMLEEVRLSFSYATGQYRDAALARLILVGGGAAIPGVREYISSALEMDVRTVAPADVADCPGALLDRCSDPALTASVGLAQFAEG